MVFENGRSVDFDVGTPFDVKVPAGADANGDGSVDARFFFALDASFHNHWYREESAGYMYTGGYGRLRVVDDYSGDVVAEHKVGPEIEYLCPQKVVQNPFLPLKCFYHRGDSDIDYKPTGFTTPSVFGSLNKGGL
jgi:hypothetical protein